MILLTDTAGYDWPIILSAIAALMTTIIATVSIYFTIKMNKNSVKPILSTVTASFDDRFGVRLKNYGNGPAIITKIRFRLKDSSEEKISIIHFFNYDENDWDDCYIFIADEYFLSPGESINLALMTSERVSRISFPSYEERKKEFDDIEKKIIITVEYKDVYGDKMKRYRREKSESGKKNTKRTVFSFAFLRRSFRIDR